MAGLAASQSRALPKTLPNIVACCYFLRCISNPFGTANMNILPLCLAKLVPGNLVYAICIELPLQVTSTTLLCQLNPAFSIPLIT